MKTKEEIEKEFWNNGWTLGRMISGSKSGYFRNRPDGKPVFNANIISKAANGKVWYGDLDLVFDDQFLIDIQKVIGDFCVLSEHNGRFSNEEISYEEALTVSEKIYHGE